jgi:hypothetical protein
MIRNVLILGCGRSGTSIFGELFESLPPFVYLDEPLADPSSLPPNRPTAVKVPRLGEGVVAPPGCALPDDMLARFPVEPRVVFWQVRHPFDAVCSLRTGIAEGWDHHPRPPDWRDWQKRPLVERCAHHWATINSLGYQQVADVALVNRFEEMIDDPVSVGRSAAAAVGLDAEGVCDAVSTWAIRVRNENDDRFVEARTSRRHSRPDHVRRVGRWKENLTPRDCELIRPIVAGAALNFGYSLQP